jgi:hypothetical protein
MLLLSGTLGCFPMSAFARSQTSHVSLASEAHWPTAGVIFSAGRCADLSAGPDKPARCDVRTLHGATPGPGKFQLGQPTGGSNEHMSRGDGRSHAWLARKKGELGEPFLPKVGELYLVNTTIYTFGHDPAADRPAVVISVPPRSGIAQPDPVRHTNIEDCPRCPASCRQVVEVRPRRGLLRPGVRRAANVDAAER